LPKGSSIVLCSLNFAVDAAHHSRRILQSMSSESLDDCCIIRKERSYKSLIFTRYFDSLKVRISRTIARLNNRHERGSPCLTPRVTKNGSFISPLIITIVSALVYGDLTALQNLGGNPMCSRTHNIYV
jgi:hypothetical protein